MQNAPRLAWRCAGCTKPVRQQRPTTALDSDLHSSGSGRDDLDLSEIRVINDLDRDGTADPGEPLLARGRATADNGSLRLTLATPLEFSSQ